MRGAPGSGAAVDTAEAGSGLIGQVPARQAGRFGAATVDEGVRVTPETPSSG